MAFVILSIFVIFAAVALAAYLFMTRKFGYWASRGVFELKPTPFFGNVRDVLTFQKSAGEVFTDLYRTSSDLNYMGFYLLDKPSLLLRDPALIKRILVKDFDHFTDRHTKSSTDDILGNANLLLVKNPHWKMVRTKLTPVFTSAKMRQMHKLILAVGEDLDAHLASLESNPDGTVVEFKEVTAKYATDVIATSAYGLQVNSLNNPEAEFRKRGRQIFDYTIWRAIEFTAMFFAPDMIKFLGLRFFTKRNTQFLREAIWDTLTTRMKNGIRRHDLIDTLIDLKRAQEQHTDTDDPNAFEFDGDNLTAQAAIFFTGGFETTSSAMCFTLYELALQPDIQSRLRTELTTALEESNGEISYEMVMQLPYLDMVISEALRKYPSLPFLDRVATREYKIPEIDFIIEKGMPIYIPVLGLHYDPKYFPDPERFDPERFSDENKRSRPSCVYMPFGEGPRNCIGLRLALLQVKFGILKIIAKYEVTPCAKTIMPLRMNPRSLLLNTKGGCHLRLRKVSAAT